MDAGGSGRLWWALVSSVWHYLCWAPTGLADSDELWWALVGTGSSLAGSDGLW